MAAPSVAIYYDSDIDATLFIAGTSSPALFGGKDLFLKGYPRYRQSNVCELYTSGAYAGAENIAAPVFIQGGYSSGVAIPSYVAGCEAVSGYLTLSIVGDAYSQNNYCPAYINGASSLFSSFDLYTSGVNGSNIAQCILYIQGPNSSTSDRVDLFIRGD